MNGIRRQVMMVAVLFFKGELLDNFVATIVFLVK